MSKRRKKIDPNQRTFDFSFEKRVSAHLAEKSEILESLGQAPEPRTMESFDEACIEQAAAVKRAIRKSGKSRPQIVDDINAYFGLSEGDKRYLSIHMFNHYLSKPTEYLMPGALLFAIHNATESLEPCQCFAEAEGGEVISKEDKQHLMLGKMEAAVWEMNRLKKELKNGNKGK